MGFDQQRLILYVFARKVWCIADGLSVSPSSEQRFLICFVSRSTADRDHESPTGLSVYTDV